VKAGLMYTMLAKYKQGRSELSWKLTAHNNQ